MKVSHPGDAAENEADRVAEKLLSGNPTQPSQALALRNAMRVTSTVPMIQRHIKGNQTWPHGKLEINFTKTDATTAGVFAKEIGEITFTPSAAAPDTKEIRFVQLGGAADAATGAPFDFTGTPQANINLMQTAADPGRGIEGGFHVDQSASSLRQRTKRTDRKVRPYYDVTGPPIPGNRIGKKKGASITKAVLEDTPGFNAPLKFRFVTSVKDGEHGIYWGTVLWSFETFLDGGIAKIKDEHKSFQRAQGATTDEAVRIFNEFYRNPGTPGAP